MHRPRQPKRDQQTGKLRKPEWYFDPRRWEQYRWDQLVASLRRPIRPRK